jgi:hypothetical protein
MKNLVMIIIFSVTGIKSHCQSVSAFLLQQVQNTVTMQFTINSGNTCNGIDILRSIDSIHYSVIGNISGVCGSTTDDVTYSFTDFNPVINFDNYYKLDLNVLGFTPVEKIHVYNQEGGVVLFPNPSESSTGIFYPSTAGRTASIELFNSLGKRILIFENVKQNPFEFQTGHLNAGIYFLRLRVDQKSEFTRILIKN